MPRLIAVALIVMFGMSGAALPAQRGRGELAATSSNDVLSCTALANLALQDLPDAPAKILSARIMDVPDSGLGGGRGGSISTQLKQYCQVIGYVGPQNKFEMRLPLPSDWNQKFFFSACAGFCGAVNGAACNPALARGYAAVTTNGGHDGGQVFDGLWAAYAPRLQEDYGWRSAHIVTIAAKAITTKYYGRPIAHSYVSGCSKGGQTVLKEAQQSPAITTDICRSRRSTISRDV